MKKKLALKGFLKFCLPNHFVHMWSQMRDIVYGFIDSLWDCQHAVSRGLKLITHFEQENSDFFLNFWYVYQDTQRIHEQL